MAVTRLLRGAAVLPVVAAASAACYSSELRYSQRCGEPAGYDAGLCRSRSSSVTLGCWSLSVHRKAASSPRWSAVRCALVEEMAVEAGTGASASQANGAPLPELLTEFMVDMKCEGCVKSVRNKLEPLDGVKVVDVDLANQVVKVLGSATIKSLSSALEQSGRRARLIGQGLPERFAVSAAVAEFKGPQIHGVVRFGQVSMELARFEASFSGLSAGPHGLSINLYGDLRRGAASTGPIYNPTESIEHPLGDLGALEVNEKGEVDVSGTKSGLNVGDLIGRALVVYEDQDKSKDGIAAAVIARSAGVGENYKALCTCDGTVIWESSSNDYVKSQM